MTVQRDLFGSTYDDGEDGTPLPLCSECGAECACHNDKICDECWRYDIRRRAFERQGIKLGPEVK